MRDGIKSILDFFQSLNAIRQTDSKVIYEVRIHPESRLRCLICHFVIISLYNQSQRCTDPYNGCPHRNRQTNVTACNAKSPHRDIHTGPLSSESACHQRRQFGHVFLRPRILSLCRERLRTRRLERSHSPAPSARQEAPLAY